jgi:hypothetical protein
VGVRQVEQHQPQTAVVAEPAGELDPGAELDRTAELEPLVAVAVDTGRELDAELPRRPERDVAAKTAVDEERSLRGDHHAAGRRQLRDEARQPVQLVVGEAHLGRHLDLRVGAQAEGPGADRKLGGARGKRWNGREGAQDEEGEEGPEAAGSHAWGYNT